MTSGPMRRGGIVALLALTVLLIVKAALTLHDAFAGGTAVDYLSFASTGLLLRQGDHCIYCAPDLAAAQQQLLGYRLPVGGDFPVTFPYPSVVAVPAMAFSLMSLQTGADVFIGINVAAMAIACLMLVHWMRPRIRAAPAVFIAVAGVFSLAADSGILLGQMDGLLLLSTTAALRALDRGHDARAGLLLSPLLLKISVFWLVPVLLIAAGRKRALAVIVAVGVVIAGASLWLTGPESVPQLLTALRGPGYQELNLASNTIPTLVARPFQSNTVDYATALVLALLSLPVIVAMRARLRADPVAAVACGIVLSIAFSPHLGDYSLMLLAPPLAVLAMRRLPVAIAAALALTVTTGVPWDLLPLRLTSVALVVAVIWLLATAVRLWRQAPVPASPPQAA